MIQQSTDSESNVLSVSKQLPCSIIIQPFPFIICLFIVNLLAKMVLVFFKTLVSCLVIVQKPVQKITHSKRIVGMCSEFIRKLMVLRTQGYKVVWVMPEVSNRPMDDMMPTGHMLRATHLAR